MHHRIRGSRVVATVLVTSLTSIGLVACGTSSSGGSSADPSSLLKETFAGSHKISSGILNLTLTIDPSGSSTLSGPIRLSFGGPFQSRGTGKLPQSDFNVNVSAMGKTGSLGILSTGSSGYVTLQGTSYRLPKATFQKLASSFSQLGPSGGNANSSSELSKLGIRPLDWLVNPTIVGTENVGGTATTRIRANVNVAAFLNDINTFLRKASSLGVPKTSGVSAGLSPATRSEIAKEVRNPTFDVWTGNDDKTLRKMTIGVLLPVSGQASTVLGGMRSADIGLSMQYANLNQPQSITAPKSVRPYSEFTSKVQSFVQSLQGSLGSGALPGSSGATGSSGSGSASGSGSGSGSAAAGISSSVQRYSRCVAAAGSDVAKMQRCAALLNGK
jgi:hypothetical protein